MKVRDWIRRTVRRRSARESQSRVRDQRRRTTGTYPCPAWGHQRTEDRGWVRGALKTHTPKYSCSSGPGGRAGGRKITKSLELPVHPPCGELLDTSHDEVYTGKMPLASAPLGGWAPYSSVADPHSRPSRRKMQMMMELNEQRRPPPGVRSRPSSASAVKTRVDITRPLTWQVPPL